MYFSRVILVALSFLLAWGAAGILKADDVQVEVTTGVDLVNRYIWRGLEFGGAPSIQPTLAVSAGPVELGSWAAYTMSNQSTDADEIDFWLGVSHEFENSIRVSALVTDYYFPNAGIDFFNFNNYDDDDGPGAHTLEFGLAVTGPESFPLTISGYINFYNDAGNNTYFQVDLPVTVSDTELNFFAGVTGGSEDNPDYYGSDEFALINVGVTASKEIVITEQFSLPLFVSYIMNPKLEISYVVAGISL